MGLVSDVYDLLLAEGLAGPGTDWDMLERRVMDEPTRDQLVILTEDGGMEPETPAPVGIGDSAMMNPQLQVRVRGRPRDTGEAAAQAHAIFALLHGRLRQTAGSTYYHRIKALTPEPVFIGFDARDRPEFTQSFRARRKVLTTSA